MYKIVNDKTNEVIKEFDTFLEATVYIRLYHPIDFHIVIYNEDEQLI